MLPKRETSGGQGKVRRSFWVCGLENWNFSFGFKISLSDFGVRFLFSNFRFVFDYDISVFDNLSFQIVFIPIFLHPDPPRSVLFSGDRKCKSSFSISSASKGNLGGNGGRRKRENKGFGKLTFGCFRTLVQISVLLSPYPDPPRSCVFGLPKVKTREF